MRGLVRASSRWVMVAGFLAAWLLVSGLVTWGAPSRGFAQVPGFTEPIGTCREVYCGDCENHDAEVARIEAQIRALAEQARLLRQDLNDAIARRDAARDAIYGSGGAAVAFFRAVINTAGAGAGAGSTVTKVADVVDKGVDVAQGDFGFVVTEVRDRALDAAAKERIRNAAEAAREHYQRTGNAQETTQRFLQDSRGARWIDRGKAIAKWLKFATSLPDLYDKGSALADLISAYFEADQEAEAYQRRLDEIDAEIERLTLEKQLIRDACEQQAGREDPPQSEEPEPKETESEASEAEDGEPDPTDDAGQEVPNEESLQRAGEALPDLMAGIDTVIVGIAETVLPPLTPFLTEDWQNLPPPVLFYLVEELQPALEKTVADIADLVDEGYVISVWLGMGSPDEAGAGVEEVLTTAPPDRAAAARETAATPPPPPPGVRIDLPADLPPPYRWYAVPPGAGPAGEVVMEGGESDQALALPPGRYDVYWAQTYAHTGDPMLLAEGVEAPNRAGQPLALPTNMGVDLSVAGWLPPLDPSYGWWGAVPAGTPAADAVAERVNWSNEPQPLLLPAGTYDLYWVQDYQHAGKPLAIARAVAVGEDGRVAVEVGTGVRLSKAPWVAPLDPSYGWWGAAPTGTPADATAAERVNWTTEGDAVVLPPGTYDLVWVQDYEHAAAPLTIATGITVDEGGPTEVTAATGLALAFEGEAPSLDPSYGWWGVAAAGDVSRTRLHWQTGATDAPLLLPAGRYDVLLKRDYASPVEVWVEGVEVVPGTLTTVTVTEP